MLLSDLTTAMQESSEKRLIMGSILQRKSAAGWDSGCERWPDFSWALGSHALAEQFSS